MTPKLAEALEKLSPTQRQAVQWGEGAALVLAGPGAGKTTVLTTRVARILSNTPNMHFRILALTFTTKAGDEMRARVESMVPGLSERTVIGTFHSFCARVLRQHGSHLGIKPDFGIYDQDEDRAALLRDAVGEVGLGAVVADDARWLKTIDRLRSSLVSPQKSATHFQNAATGERVARVYGIYENALRAHNVTDFNGMILDTCRLVHQIPAVAARIRKSYPYWLIDEFQDTTPAQYRLVRFLAGEAFKNIFVVADDDQIIYEWAGASYRQIAAFREHFGPELIQLVENRRCPPEVVRAANNLIARNSERTPGKAALVATRASAGPAVVCQGFKTDVEEATAVAADVSALEQGVWGNVGILSRTRAVLRPVLEALGKAGVKASLVARRGRFVSPQFLWLESCLELALRPMDERTFTTMAVSANRIASMDVDVAILAAEAQSSNANYLEYWALAVKDTENEIAADLAKFALRLVQSRSAWRQVVAEAVPRLLEMGVNSGGLVSDAEEDGASWETIAREIRSEKGSQPDLDELLQGIALRSKEPPLDGETVRLMTIHAAKGLEFDYVWLIGAAEQILPSWQSLKATARGTELEEERRNFFVAITRTRKRLTVTYASRYSGWERQVSRFIEEMKDSVATGA